MNFEEYLQAYINGLGDNRLIKAMLYATSGGKHFRPELLFAVVKGFGISEDKAYPAAAALEMLHSYSLIHDDLPCMDNDDYRRGKLTVHKAFGEDIAVLCGDALLTHAFGVLANAPYSPDKCLKMISYLASLGGLNGMIYGQLLDISVHDYDDLSQKELDEIQDYKTGALFKAALYFGMILADDFEHQDFYDDLALVLGRIFQTQDDLFDIKKTFAETGKSASDIKNHKATSISIKSIEEVEEELKRLFYKAYALLKRGSFDTTYLEEIVRRMENR